MKEIEAKFRFLEKHFINGIRIRCDEEGELFKTKNTSKIWIDEFRFLEVGKKDGKIWIKSNKKDFLLSLSIIITFKVYDENFQVWINGEEIEYIKMWDKIEEIISKAEDLNIMEIKIEEQLDEEMMVWIVRPEYEDEYLRMLNEKSTQ